MTQVAMILSGCGVYDGSEIYETVCAMLALAKANISYQCFAPNIDQHHVINHLTQQEMNETRNVLIEAARLARGNIKDLSSANPNDFAASFFPGGFGAAKNLSDAAFKGADMTVQKDVLHFAKTMADAKKPQVFMCISPMMISKIYGPGVEFTIGNDEDCISEIKKMGGKHKIASASDVVIDKQHKVISTPAYMLADNILQVEKSTLAAVEALQQFL